MEQLQYADCCCGFCHRYRYRRGGRLLQYYLQRWRVLCLRTVYRRQHLINAYHRTFRRLCWHYCHPKQRHSRRHLEQQQPICSYDQFIRCYFRHSCGHCNYYLHSRRVLCYTSVHGCSTRYYLRRSFRLCWPHRCFDRICARRHMDILSPRYCLS